MDALSHTGSAEAPPALAMCRSAGGAARAGIVPRSPWVSVLRPDSVGAPGAPGGDVTVSELSVPGRSFPEHNLPYGEEPVPGHKPGPCWKLHGGIPG